MKNLLKNIQVFYLLLWCMVSIGSYYYFFVKTSTSSNSTTTQTVETVSLWDLTQSIKVVWSVELVDEQQLRFNRTGKVTKVYVKEWQTIQKDELLAELDKTNVWVSIEQQKLNVENAKMRLNDLYVGLDTSKKLDYERNIEQTEKNIQTTQKEWELLKTSQKTAVDKIQKDIEYKKQDISLLEKSLSDAQKSYDLLLSEQQKNLKNTTIEQQNTLDDMSVSLQKDLLTAQESIEQMDAILWVSEKNRAKNDTYEIYLSAKNTSYKNEAVTHLSKAFSQVQALEKLDLKDFETAITVFQETFATLFSASDALYQALDNSVESATFSSSEISSKKSTISALRSKIQSNIQTFLSYKKKIETLSDIALYKTSQEIALSKSEDSIESVKNNLKKAKNDLLTLEKNLEDTLLDNTLKLQSKQNTLTNMIAQWEIQKLTYQEALAGPTQNTIANAQNEIKKAELALQDAMKEWENYELRAPFSGVVRKVDLQVWDNLATDNSKYIYIENPNLVEIPVLLDQVDIVKVSLGQKAWIKFDAYPTLKVEWEIRIIDYTPVESSGIVSYTIKIVITDTAFDKKVLSGMTADIEIITLEKKWVPFISTSAMSSIGGKNYVEVQSKGRTEIQVWVSSGGKTEIISWVSVGEKIILPQVTTSKSTSSSKQNSLISLPWTNRMSWGGNMWGGGFR